MRPSLENIELIDKYLNGELSGKEKEDFESALNENAELQQQVQIQKDIIQTAKRIGIRKEIKKAAKGNGGFNAGNIAIIAGIIIAISASAYFFYPKEAEKTEAPTKEISTITKEEETSEALPEVKKENSTTTANTQQQSFAGTSKNIVANTTPKEKVNDCYNFNGLNTWVKPDVQIFPMDAAKSTTIEGKEGTLIIVPSNAFVDDNNQVVQGEVVVELVEALNLEDMILYNLGTTSNGTPLESGGMLHIRAVSNNKEVKINPARPLYIEIPTNEIKDGMMAFEGKVQENGKLNWENPKALKKYLVNVPLKDLDFLPEGFTQKVETYVPYKNHKKANKDLVDSLYYSLEQSTRTLVPLALKPRSEKITTSIIRNNKGGMDSTYYGSDAIATATAFSNQKKISCGINPSSIKTIKTKEFSKSFIATKEFEDRVRALHKLDSGDAMLKIYVDHLNQDLCVSDSLVAEKLSGKDKNIFENFASQKCTNIKDAAIYQEQLSAYYSKKRNEYQKAQTDLISTWKNMQTKELNDLAATIKKENERAEKMANNLPKRSVATANSHAFNWAKSGWVNIDAYLHILSNGFISLKMKINNMAGTTEIYQWLNTINNVTPLNIENGFATALFPLEKSAEGQQMKNTYCMAIDKKGDAYQWFALRYNPYASQQIEVNLMLTSIQDIRAQMKTFKVDGDLQKRMEDVDKILTQSISNSAIAFPRIQWTSKKGPSDAEKKQEQILKENQMIVDLKSVAFLCYCNQVDSFEIEKPLIGK
ncbi:MAG: hypothetical protein NT150_15375 [Bacteroidetes bacterium]|nr:hypothetical protein [Bacteroidota bacterium]